MGKSGHLHRRRSPVARDVCAGHLVDRVVPWFASEVAFSEGCVFPLFFLLWLIPMPEFVLDQIVSLLQQGTAAFARLLLVTVGVPTTQDGLTLTVPGLTVEVAQECSSIRSSMILVVISMVVSYLLVRSWWGRTIVILAAIPLAVAKNGLRVFTLAVLGAYVDPGILDSPLHHQGESCFWQWPWRQCLG